jgi:hypothetical protein
MSGAAFDLSFEGSFADRRVINAYDVSRALAGFERSLALTTHAVLNGKIIVQAPALKGADVLFLPPEPGSWKTKALVVCGGLWALNNVEPTSPIGHLLYSAYDYVLNSSTGVTLDYDKPIRVLIDEARQNAPEASAELNVNVLDAVIERAEKSIEDMHRPIVESETAHKAIISFGDGFSRKPLTLDRDTFEYISRSVERDNIESQEGAISSYNINSFTGRIFVPALQRTVPFLLSESVRGPKYVDKITNSLRSNALKYGNELFEFDAVVMESVSGRIKRFIISDL